MKINKLKNLPSSLLWALIYFVLIGLLSVFLGQDFNWDLRNYHFYNPYMLLNNRFHYDIMPAQIQTFFNPLMDVPFFGGIYYLKISPIVIGFLLGGIHGLNIWLVHNIVYYSLGCGTRSALTNLSNKYRQILSFMAAFTSIFGAGYFSEIGSTMGDSTTSVFVLGSLLIIILSLSIHQKITIKYIGFAGLVLGLGVGLKLTVALYGIALVIAINFSKTPQLTAGFNLREKLLNFFTLVATIVFGSLITLGYWMNLMWQNFSSPLFPFYNTIFKSPYIEIDRNFEGVKYLPNNIWQFFFYPFFFMQKQSLVSELEFRDIRLGVAYLVLVVLLVFLLSKFFFKLKISTTRNSSIVKEDILSVFIPFFVASYVIWQKMFCIYRYLMPLELLAPALVVLVVGYLIPNKKMLLGISLVFFTLMIVTVKPLDWGRLSWSSDLFGIEQKKLTKYENSIIVLWGDEPTSYIVPSFPSTTRFIRIKGNAGLSPNTLMFKNGQEILKNSQEIPLYFLERDPQEKKAEKSQDLKIYNLKFSGQDCTSLLTKSEAEKYYLCQLNKDLKEQ